MAWFWNFVKSLNSEILGGVAESMWQEWACEVALEMSNPQPAVQWIRTFYWQS